ncbi:MAG: 3-deoxy-8-phosphooctulonate synthase [Nitrospinae bacterium]|nr:3-deoxy-8-phosphooctulonate synthase [Nitrospinota bacterium]
MTHHAQRIVEARGVRIGNPLAFTLIAGPCVIEDEKSALHAAELLKNITAELGIGLVYKSSFDKANRSSIKSFRGIGMKEGLRILNKVRETFDVPVISDVHAEEEIPEAGAALDFIQIPAFLCRQTDLLIAAAKTGKAVNVKKGQFMAPWDMAKAAEKLTESGNEQIMLTERGTTFGYNNLVNDFRGLQIMAQFGFPVVYDATHSVQLPSARGESSGGERKFVPALSRAAVAVGVAAVFMEVHPNPDTAPCDGPNMLFMKDLPNLLKDLQVIDRLVKRL